MEEGGGWKQNGLAALLAGRIRVRGGAGVDRLISTHAFAVVRPVAIFAPGRAPQARRL